MGGFPKHSKCQLLLTKIVINRPFLRIIIKFLIKCKLISLTRIDYNNHSGKKNSVTRTINITIRGVLSTIIDYHLYKKVIFPEANYHGGEIRVEVNTHPTPASTFDEYESYRWHSFNNYSVLLSTKATASSKHPSTSSSYPST